MEEEKNIGVGSFNTPKPQNPINIKKIIYIYKNFVYNN
jgi:hypothetical protein